MAMRGFLLQNTMGAAAYTYHAGEVMKTLAKATPGGTYEIKDWSKLELLADVAGVDGSLVTRWPNESPTPSGPSSTAITRKPPRSWKPGSGPRVELWKKLGIMPGGVLHEHVRATASSMTNIDGDYLSLALKGLRLGLATAYGAQVPLELAQDALWGTPTPHAIKVTSASSTPSM